MEQIGGVPFAVARLKVRGDGFFDRRAAARALCRLHRAGVSRAAVPGIPYIKERLEWYHMTGISHLPLMRRLSGELAIRAAAELEGPATAVLYARKIDRDVLACARLACDFFREVQLDFGSMTESVRRALIDETGAAPIIGEMEGGGPRVRVLFDRPPNRFAPDAPGGVIINCSGRACEQEDSAQVYNDLEAEKSGLPPDTDSTGVLAALVQANPENAQGIKIVRLLKKGE